MKNIIVTGGLGFIGSHTCVELIKQGFNPIIIDNLDNSELWIKDRIEEITSTSIQFYQGDCIDKIYLEGIFKKHKVDGIIHFAANKAVGESVENPLKYYGNNLHSLVTVLEVAGKFECENFVFSSSCTVYGSPDTLPVDEAAEIKKAGSPYGTSKIYSEKIIEDFVAANPNFKSIALRYFNPIGAHQSSKIGELPLGVPNNLVPFITQTVAGLRSELTVFGDDYKTKDGSCIRDFIHVTDLAKAHIKAFEFLAKKESNVCEAINIGTGDGVSVLELIKTFEKSTGEKVPYKIGPRRDGDIPAVYADATKSKDLLGWEAEITLEQALLDAWNWQVKLK